METRKLGKSNLNLSVITYGSFGIGGTMWGGTEKKDALEAIHASLDHGVSTIDTAPFYGFGLSEQWIGEAIKGKDRTKVQLLTKFGMVWDNSNNGKGDFFMNLEDKGKIYPIYKYASKADVMKEAEGSLKRLQVDYIDLLQVHWFDRTTPVDETMEALQLLIDQGKILAAGVSNFSALQMQEAEKTAMLASNQVPYSMLNRSIETSVIPYAQRNNIGIIAYSPLERGLLTGKYLGGQQLQSGDHRNSYFSQFNPEKVKSLLDTIKPIAERKNATVPQLVLKWTTIQPGITVVLAGARNAAQAVSNAKAMEVDLDDEELDVINDELAR